MNIYKLNMTFMICFYLLYHLTYDIITQIAVFHETSLELIVTYYFSFTTTFLFVLPERYATSFCIQRCIYTYPESWHGTAVELQTKKW